MKKTLLTLTLSFAFGVMGFSQDGQYSQKEVLAYNVLGSTINHVPSGPSDNFFNDGQDDPTVIFYPNPVKSYLNVKFPDKGNYTVRIYNIVGEKITEKSVYEDDIVKLNLSELQNGMYFLSYELKGKVYTKTFSKTQ